MTTALPPKQASEEPLAKAEEAADPSGRDRLRRNVVTSWATHLVFVAAGFVLPRFMDRHLGQTALGIWDFGWSLVSYFGLTQLGIGASVNRFVAKYRSTGDVEGLRRTVSSVLCVEVAATTAVVALTVAAAATVPRVTERLRGHEAEAQVVILCLGLALAVQVLLDSFRGVVTGCHRWDIHNALRAATHGGTVALMVGALLAGGGLASLAVVQLVGTALGEIAGAVAGYRLCPELRVGVRWVSRKHLFETFRFGVKTMIGRISELLLYQTNSLVVAGALGPAALALYARPCGLVRNAQSFVQKLAFVLTPTTSALQAAGRLQELQRLATDASRYGAFVAMPLLGGLAVLGDPLLHVWMGARYEQGIVIVVLSLGHFFPITQQPAANLLAGLDAHGRLGLVQCAAAAAAALLGYVAVAVLDWGLLGAALALVLPQMLVSTLFVPVYVCRTLKMDVWAYLLEVYRRPLLCAVPVVLAFGVGRFVFPDAALRAIAFGGGSGAIVIAALYWRYALPRRDGQAHRGGTRATAVVGAGVRAIVPGGTENP